MVGLGVEGFRARRVHVLKLLDTEVLVLAAVLHVLGQCVIIV